MLGTTDVAVRLATAQDSDSIFEWRNDAQTRVMSRSKDSVSLSTHRRWFRAALKSADRVLFICESVSDGHPVGMTRFDFHAKDLVEMSINLAPEARGQGYAKPCLSKSLVRFVSEYPSVKKVVAEISPSNVGSIRSFEGVGFVFQDEQQGFGRYLLAELPQTLG